jgi:tRNA(adenine34) deaminase
VLRGRGPDLARGRRREHGPRQHPYPATEPPCSLAQMSCTEQSTDCAFMKEALAEARLACQKGEIPVGAVAVYEGRVVGRAHNEKETRKDPTAHAEILALRQAAVYRGGWRLLGVTLYCTMEPCPMCAGAMIQARLPRLVFAVNDPEAGAAGSVLDLLRSPFLSHQVQVTSGVLASEVQELLLQFFAGLRNGSISRFSNNWAQGLANNADPV